MTLLDGLRVLDFSEEIAGPYATKLLADAGADVIKVESAAGDPLRRWSASGADLDGRDGALFQFLNTSKQSVIGDLSSPLVVALLDGADVVFESGQLRDEDLEALRARHPTLMIVSVTPFGRVGPFASRAATEFTLQAWCGSTAGRGTPAGEPLHVGGRLGEWISGTYAAVAALAAARGEQGDHVDVSMLECMAITLGGYTALHASLAGTVAAALAHPELVRTLEVPSIEPTVDGLVGVCTVTGQQFEDFLLLIERPELRGDKRFATAMHRTRHQVEFETMVHAWTTQHTTQEIIEQATLFRIPVAPVGTPETVTRFEQFVERGVFVSHPGGGFVQPRPPYRVEGVDARPFGPAPRLGEHSEGVAWPPRLRQATPSRGEPGRPLAGLRVADFTAFWAGPSATQLFAALGADVVKIESTQRPDGIRFSSTKRPSDEQWWEWSALYQANNVNKRDVTLDLGTDDGRRLALDLVAQSDIAIENFSPRVFDNFGISWEEIHERNPRTIMVRMPAFGLDGPWRDRTGFAQTIEQATGMAWMSGFADGPPVIPRGACDPLAGMHAAVATLAALAERDRSGMGRFIEVTMIEAALNAAAELVIEHSAYGASLARDGNRGPVAAPQGLYPCVGDEQWLALAIVDDGQWQRFRALLGDPAWARSADLAPVAGRRAARDRIDEHLRDHFARRPLDEVVEELAAAGIPAAPVVSPISVLDNPQLRSRGFVEQLDSAVVGRHECLGLPMRFASRSGAWFASSAPTLGQHNDEVLTGLLGVSEDEVRRLAAAGVIGRQPAR